MACVAKWVGWAAAAVAIAAAQPASAQTKFKMMYTAVTGFTSAYVAQEQGFFKKRGIDVEFLLTANSANNAPALVSGSVDIAGPTMTSVLEAVDAGLDLVVFAGGAVYPLDKDILVARFGSGIEKPTDLKGKRVGVPGIGALLHVMLRKHLKENGVDPNDVKFVEIGFVQAADALKSGQIDAYPAVAPFSARILQSKSGYEVANWLKNTPDGTLTTVYATTRKWANDHKKQIEDFKAAMEEADEFIKTHRDEMDNAIAVYTKLPVAVLKTLAPPNLVVNVAPDRVKYWIDICKEQGIVKHDMDPKKVIFP
jgi:NitT/TauT family transport system substrate-binding protein